MENTTPNTNTANTGSSSLGGFQLSPSKETSIPKPITPESLSKAMATPLAPSPRANESSEMKTIKRLRLASFFALMGIVGVYIVLELMRENYLETQVSTTLQKSLDLPLGVVAILYVLLTIRLIFNTKKNQTTDIALLVLGGLLVVGLVYLNLFVPDLV